ncbi:MAG: hypothetical protein ABSG53_13910 [Thermoguttaceae bacterium]|jgi:hypothetical protein
MESLTQIAEELLKWFEVRYIVMIVIALALLWVQWAVFSRKKKSPPRKQPLELEIDYRSLGDEGPPAGPVKLDFMSIPVRLAAVVVAPSGRGSELPPDQVMPMVLSKMIPGLDQVVKLHTPLICPWPRQLSESGFAQTFFAKVKLPGDFGEGTPWCSIAGKFKYRGVAMMVGLVLCAADANDYGQKRIEKPQYWRDCLRVSGQS